tara:strand:- start:11369 stop:11566 length:198 start_codon:yes stop_codon:yes gene_type:complete
MSAVLAGPLLLAHLEACGDRIVCFFCPASPHFVYHILFMGGEDALSAVMDGEKLGGQEAVLPLHG